MREFTFSKVAGQRPVTLLRKNSFTGIFQEFYPDFSHYLLHFRILKKAIFQNISKRLLLIVSWDFIAWTEVLFYRITEKSNVLSENQSEIYFDKIQKVNFL